MTAPVRVLLVDDQPLVRKGLQMILGPEDGFLVVGDCADGTEVPAAVARSFAGGGCGRPLRPFGRSGCVTAATTS